MVAVSDNLLGVGLYTVAEAALYARVHPQLITRWLFGTKVGEAVLRHQLPGEDKLVSFIDFVQAMAIRAIRVQHNVPLQKIRQAVETAQEEYGVEYPFAKKHTTYLFGPELVIKLGEDQYVEVSGKHRRNMLLTKVVELYMLDLTFDVQGLASQYRAFRWERYDVSMNPQLRFGEPLVSSCGYSAQALWEASRNEGGLEAAAEAYGVELAEVEVACRYYDYLVGKSAA